MPKNKTQKNIPKDWRFKNVGEFLDYEQPTPYIVESTDYNNEYNIPVLTAGKTFILGYTNEQDGIFKNIPVIIFDDFTTAIKYVDFSFKVKSSAMKILKEKPDIVNLKFIYGWMQIHPFKVGEHKRNYLSEYQYQAVLLPPLPEQNHIVAILEIWDKYLEKLSRKIEIKKNIKKGLMQRLLTGKVRLDGFSGEWESVKLGDIGEIITGNTPPMAGKENYGDQYCWATAEDFNGKYINNTNIKLSEKGKSLSRFLPVGSILVTCIASIGKNAIANILLATNQQINSIVVNDKNDNEFIYYLINNSINLLKRYAGAGAMPILNKVTFSKIKVNIPELKEQTAIAKILTTADEEIEALEKKKKIIEEQKKFLLNNLVTGKIRTV